MEVGVRVFRHVVVENNVDSLNIHASSKEICGNQHPLAETLESLILGQSGERRQLAL